jgi:hypothetical protein
LARREGNRVIIVGVLMVVVVRYNGEMLVNCVAKLSTCTSCYTTQKGANGSIDESEGCTTSRPRRDEAREGGREWRSRREKRKEREGRKIELG